MVASLAAMWYFSPEPDNRNSNVSMCRAMTWGLWYHCGSIAFGSLIIAIIELIRIIFEFCDRQYQQLDANSVVRKVVSCCIRCCLACLDCCLKYLTDNAYIQVAISSESFCPAAFKAFFLILRHADRFMSMAMVDWIMIMLGKGTIISASGAATFYITKQYYPAVS